MPVPVSTRRSIAGFLRRADPWWIGLLLGFALPVAFPLLAAVVPLLLLVAVWYSMQLAIPAVGVILLVAGASALRHRRRDVPLVVLGVAALAAGAALLALGIHRIAP